MLLSQRLLENGRLEERTCPGSALVKMGKEECVWRRMNSQRPLTVHEFIVLCCYMADLELWDLTEKERQTRYKAFTLRGLRTNFSDGNLTLDHRQ